jgi:hypothetical protein
MYAKNMLTRREACVVLGTLGAGALALAGCEADDPTSRTGFASDTEVKFYPVHLKLYVDSYLQWHYANTRTADVPRDEQQTVTDNHIVRYQAQRDRSEVSFEVIWVDPAEMLAMAREGFPDGDGLLAMKDTVYEGCTSGVVDAGVAAIYVRDLSYHYAQTVCLVRALGSDVDLPPAATLSGKETRQFTRLQQLPSFDGMIALADPEAALEGRLANAALSHGELYLEGSPSPLGGLVGGTYAEGIADKLAVYPSQDEAMAAVTSGECQLGFALRASLERRYPEVEEVYDPSHGRAMYSGAALARSSEPGVMRDFFQFETACSD